jgi:hypothetical protein
LLHFDSTLTAHPNATLRSGPNDGTGTQQAKSLQNLQTDDGIEEPAVESKNQRRESTAVHLICYDRKMGNSLNPFSSGTDAKDKKTSKPKSSSDLSASSLNGPYSMRLTAALQGTSDLS